MKDEVAGDDGIGGVIGEMFQIRLMPRARGGPGGGTRPTVESIHGEAGTLQLQTEFTCASAQLQHLIPGADEGGQHAGKPAKVAHGRIGQTQVAAVVQCRRMVDGKSVEELGLKRAGHRETKVAGRRRGVQRAVKFPMSSTVTPVDLIAQAAEQFPHRPSWDEYFMATAVLMSTRSNCERLHVGCVIVTGGERKNRLVAAGYNGFLPGTPHVSRLRDGHEQATVHAEQNAIADAARRGSAVEGCVAYVTHYPCINCAKIMAASGLAEIRYRIDYANDPLVAPLLAEAGVKVLKL